MRRWRIGPGPPATEVLVRAAHGDRLAMMELEKFNLAVGRHTLLSMDVVVVVQCISIVGLALHGILGRVILAAQVLLLIWMVDLRRCARELNRKRNC